jgi:Ni/Fe-hydrogenase 1 B-type cytochrome subunit
MFVFWMFFIHHLYTAILVSIEEENGVMESIFSGYKFVPEHELRAAIAEESEQAGEVRPEELSASSVGQQNSQTRA